MRKTKALAFVLTIVMIAAMLPTLALADADDITAVTIKGVTVPMDAFHGSFAEALANPQILTLTAAQMADVETSIAITETGTADAIARFAAAGTAAPANFAAIESWGAELDDEALPVNTTIWIADGATQVAQIIIRQASGGSIDWDVVVNNPVFDVILPLDPAFAIDPMQTAGSGSNQIADADYKIVNASAFAVKVSFTIAAVKDAGVTIVGRNIAANTTSASPKNAFFAVLGANEVGGTEPTFANPNQGTYAYNPNTAGTLFPFAWTTNNGTAEIDFLLGAATESDPGTSGIDTLATGNRGVASFRLYGELNTLATWNTNDLQIAGAYDMVGVLPAAAANVGTASLNIVTGRVAQLGFYGSQAFSATQTNLLTVSKASYASSDLVISFNGGSLIGANNDENPLDYIRFNASSPNTADFVISIDPDADAVIYDPDAQTLTFPGSGSIWAVANWNLGPSFFDVKLKDSATIYRILLDVAT